jgi:hypothetical protein
LLCRIPGCSVSFPDSLALFCYTCSPSVGELNINLNLPEAFNVSNQEYRRGNVAVYVVSSLRIFQKKSDLCTKQRNGLRKGGGSTLVATWEDEPLDMHHSDLASAQFFVDILAKAVSEYPLKLEC